MEKLKVLVIDDEEEICAVTKSFLGKKNYLCFSASSETAALDLARKEKPQLALLDMRLGNASGLDVLRKIKEINPKIKVVMISGLGDAESRKEAELLGADDFITKPFTAAFLNDLVAEKLNAK